MNTTKIAAHPRRSPETRRHPRNVRRHSPLLSPSPPPITPTSTAPSPHASATRHGHDTLPVISQPEQTRHRATIEPSRPWRRICCLSRARRSAKHGSHASRGLAMSTALAAGIEEARSPSSHVSIQHLFERHIRFLVFDSCTAGPFCRSFASRASRTVHSLTQHSYPSFRDVYFLAIFLSGHFAAGLCSALPPAEILGRL